MILFRCKHKNPDVNEHDIEKFLFEEIDSIPDGCYLKNKIITSKEVENVINYVNSNDKLFTIDRVIYELEKRMMEINKSNLNDEEKMKETKKLIIFDTIKSANILVVYRRDRFKRISKIAKILNIKITEPINNNELEAIDFVNNNNNYEKDKLKCFLKNDDYNNLPTGVSIIESNKFFCPKTNKIMKFRTSDAYKKIMESLLNNKDTIDLDFVIKKFFKKLSKIEMLHQNDKINLNIAKNMVGRLVLFDCLENNSGFVCKLRNDAEDNIQLSIVYYRKPSIDIVINKLIDSDSISKFNYIEIIDSINITYKAINKASLFDFEKEYVKNNMEYYIINHRKIKLTTALNNFLEEFKEPEFSINDCINSINNFYEKNKMKKLNNIESDYIMQKL
jgi:hypothetical protein